MTNEAIVKRIASLLRSLPDFRGKHFLGKKIERLSNIMHWNNPNCRIALKNNYSLQIDVRTEMHRGAFWTGNYDTALIKKLTSLFEKNWIVADIGANIGYYAVPFAIQLQKLNGRLLAFEPVVNNFNVLKQNLTINQVVNSVNLFQAAVGDEEGSLDMSVAEGGATANAHIVKGEFLAMQHRQTETVPVHTFDNILHENRIDRCDFIKIDIEGAEMFMIKGGLQTFTKHLPLVYGEFNSYFMKRFGFNFLDVWEILSPLGYECYGQIGKSPWFHKINPNADTSDVLLVPPTVDRSKLKNLIRY